MLKSIKVTNFYSIGDTQELSLQINSKDILDESARMIGNKTALNLVSCLVGANASGKTTWLKALSFLFWFIQTSYQKMKNDEKIPYDPHKLKKKENSIIEIEFINNETFFTYLIEFNRIEVVRESLSEKPKRIPLFELIRKGDHAEIKTHKDIKINSADEERFKERKNVSLLSSLIDTSYLPDIDFFKKIETNVNQWGLKNKEPVFYFVKISETLFKDKKLANQILSFLKDIDLGIKRFEFDKVIFGNQNNPNEEIKRPILQCVHASKKKEFPMELFRESNGTQHAIFTLIEILPILNTGGLVVLDEIENALHPYAAKKIISLFENKKTNPNNAQLIFSTHQHILLNDRTKTQIFLTEKNNETLETEIYRLDEVEEVRNDENYFNKYIAGAYGGIPKIDWF